MVILCLLKPSLLMLTCSNTHIIWFLVVLNSSKKNFWNSSNIESSRSESRFLMFVLLWNDFGRLLNKVNFFNNKSIFFIRKQILIRAGLHNKNFFLRSCDQFFLVLWLRVCLQNFDAILSAHFWNFFKNSFAGCFLMLKGMCSPCQRLLAQIFQKKEHPGTLGWAQKNIFAWIKLHT